MKNYKRKIILGLSVLLLLSYFSYNLYSNSIQEKKHEYPKQTQVYINGHRFDVEVAATLNNRQRGLMFREHLDEDKGMLFVYDKEYIYSMWMKNTLIPLDMIWVSGDKEIVYIEKNVQPCKNDECPSMTPNRKAQYVLELYGGISDKIGFDVGNKIEFDI